MKLTIQKILFLGIGGVSMHQIALTFKELGVCVYGYDAHKNKFTKQCENAGIKVSNKFLKEFFDVDLCIKTGAVTDCKFLHLLKEKKIHIIDRAEALAWLCSKFKNVIAVAGTHGKSTTSTLIYEMLKAKFKNVSCHIGADVKNPRFNLNDDFLVVEACEYNKSFLSLFPTVSVVTNVEAEHMDCYENLFALRSAFTRFLKRAKTRFVFKEKSTLFLKNQKNINFVNETTLDISPKINGEHNLKNISLAIAVAKSFGVEDDVLINVVNSFVGLSRRYEYLGLFGNSKIFIDYAHHPTEVGAFVKTFNNDFCQNQIIFQPHTFSRTKMFLKEFVEILSKQENVIIFKEYAAREKHSAGLSAKELFLAVKQKNPSAKYCASYKSVLKNLKSAQAVAFVGAGDINLVAEKLIKTNQKC